MSRFQLTADHRDTFTVKRHCEIVEVSRSSYYAWFDSADARTGRAASEHAPAKRITAVRAADRTHGDTADPRRLPAITTELEDATILGDDGRVNQKRGARVVCERRIAGLTLRRGVRTFQY